MLLDYSKNRIDETAMSLLFDLARAAGSKPAATRCSRARS